MTVRIKREVVVACKGCDFDGNTVLTDGGLKISIGIVRREDDKTIARPEDCSNFLGGPAGRCYAMDRKKDPERKGARCRFHFGYQYAKENIQDWKLPKELVPAFRELGVIDSEEIAENAFDYSSSDFPDWYTCSRCEQAGIRLWENEKNEMHCTACAVKPEIIVDKSESGNNEEGVVVVVMKIRLRVTDWIPAIPGSRFAGDIIFIYEVKQEMLDWWNRLPEDQSHPQEAFFQ
ncbi:MAG: hypothetical protein CMI52_05000 [Parcubacteria group bacterium]|nr:hypothetical protein [Parcubacteria group bacterium]|tara:strand:- start:642 stop:1340 length:699 start_codon:yes stop_codon:yes gene_type:complete